MVYNNIQRECVRRTTTYHGQDPGRRPHKAPADADFQLAGDDVLGGPPEPLSDGIVRGHLHGELEVRHMRGIVATGSDVSLVGFYGS